MILVLCQKSAEITDETNRSCQKLIDAIQKGVTQVEIRIQSPTLSKLKSFLTWYPRTLLRICSGSRPSPYYMVHIAFMITALCWILYYIGYIDISYHVSYIAMEYWKQCLHHNNLFMGIAYWKWYDITGIKPQHHFLNESGNRKKL